MAIQHMSPMWRRKQRTRLNKGSQTPGKSKGETCKTDPRKKFFFSDPKARNHPQYSEWHAYAKSLNEGRKS